MQLSLPALRALVALVALCATLFAHDPGVSSSTLRQTGATLLVDLRIDDLDLETLVAIDSDRDGRASLAELREHERAIGAAIREALVLRSAGAPLTLEDLTIDLDENDDVRVLARAPGIEANEWSLELRALDALPRGHRHLARVLAADGSTLAETLLHRGAPRVVVDTRAPATLHAWSRFADFVILGVEHILIGWDHLAFVFLLLIGISLRGGVVLLSAFTLAHSITLGLATLDVLRVPGTLVEIAIAASIAVLAWVNLRRSVRPASDAGLSSRAAVSFGLGLLHGFGFAGVLREFLPRDDVVVPLLGFNVGVELGQVLVGAAFCALLAILARTDTRRARAALLLNSAALALGVFWVVERSSQGA